MQMHSPVSIFTCVHLVCVYRVFVSVCVCLRSAEKGKGNREASPISVCEWSECSG